jgi:hypothetical protein
MSGTLFERARELRTDLETLAELRASAGEAGELSLLKDSLGREVDELKQALAGRAVLAKAGLEVPLPTSHEGLRKRAQSLRERFEKDRRAEVLKKGQVWRTCLEQAGETAKTIAGEVRERWRAYEAEIFTGDTPSAVEKLLAPTTANKAAFRRYKAAFGELRQLFRTTPRSEEEISAARLKAHELEEIARAFDFDVPQEVKSFLEAVLSGGAPLETLTQNVIDWLKENNTHEQYRIVALRQA